MAHHHAVFYSAIHSAFIDAAVEWARDNTVYENEYDWEAYRAMLEDDGNGFATHISSMDEWVTDKLEWFGIGPDRRAEFIDWGKLFEEDCPSHPDDGNIRIMTAKASGNTYRISNDNWKWDDQEFSEIHPMVEAGLMWYADLDEIYREYNPIKKEPVKITLVAKGDECETKGNPTGMIAKV